ncbi:MAG: sulfatase-like hydrolase/transferase [Pelolinea sp.]|nr:sulfatase-like hydrolase/transferase [Pelolinea sp.]
MLKKFPFHTFLLAIYFPAALLATNLGEIKIVTIVRLMLVMLAFSVGLLFLLNIFMRDIRKAGLIVSLMIVLFSVYGLLYAFFKSPQVLNGLLGRHRVLAGIIVLLIGLVSWAVTKKIRHIAEISLIVNLFAIYLLAMPLIQTAPFALRANSDAAQPPSLEGKAAQTALDGDALPDIYYIILDAYDRGDYLASEFDFDNSQFLDLLRDSGFYVADCSRSNYAHTFLSLSSTLNMDYVQTFLTPDTISEFALKDALVHSELRDQLSALGYQTSAFDNVHWDFSDADTFYAFEIKPILNPYLFPVESVFINNSALKMAEDMSPRFTEAIQKLASSAVKDHYLQQKYILDTMDAVVQLDSPKFVFMHIEKPHGPYVFEPDGDFIEEDAFYRDTYHAAINGDYDKRGYVKQIEYLNRRITAFVDQLLKTDEDAIVIIQGDHGIQENEDLNARMAILNAVYFPDQNYASFYPSITPVNSFRIVLDQFFSGEMGLLEDASYYSYREDKMEYFLVEEIMAGCVP